MFFFTLLTRNARGTRLEQRNYHAFYQLCASGGPGSANLGISEGAGGFDVLTKGGCTEIEGVNDAEDFKGLEKALADVGLGEEERADVWKLVASLLHLGNLKLADADGKTTVSAPCSPSLLGSLLGCDFAAVENAVCIRQVRSGRGSLMSMNLDVAQARAGVEALIKHCYGSLFHFLVKKINQSHALAVEAGSFIGILDIFGFEIMKYNSLSQLCINFANEKLQQQFNQQVFVREKEVRGASSPTTHRILP